MVREARAIRKFWFVMRPHSPSYLHCQLPCPTLSLMYAGLVAFFFFAAAALRPLFIAEPGYPPNAVSGGTVVAELLLSPGGVTNVRIMSGGGAFAESAASALRAWRFLAKQKASVVVVVHFRDPNFFSTGPATRTITSTPPDVSLAYPKTVVDPVYPANSLGQGSVVLRADIAPTGTLVNTEVIKGAGSLTQASIDAVRNWTFFPAKDAKGRPIESSVFVVLVFRMPITAPARLVQ